jgi:hypothetical protein
MKQVVTETYTNKTENGWRTCNVELSYETNKNLFGKKQYEEVILRDDTVKVVIYWVNVANDGAGPVSLEKINKKSIKYQAKQKVKKDLHALKLERMERYAKTIAEQEDFLFKNRLDRKTGEDIKLPSGIIPTNEDIINGKLLQKQTTRKSKVRELVS